MRQRRAAGAAAAILSAGWHAGVLALCAVLIAGCSARWGAPWESREGSGRRTITGPTYAVRAGDTLQAIGWQAGVDHRRLAEWNRLRSADKIFVGQVLRLTPPDGEGAREAPPPRVPAASPSPAQPEPPRRAITNTRVAAETAAATAGSLRWQWPTTGRVVRTFVANDPGRKGLKIRGALGQPIVAAESGQVVYSGSGLVGYGPLIIIQHNNNYLSAYGHNRKLLVQQGDQVTKGAKIAEMGLAAGEPLLHFEVRRDGEPVDPVALLPRR